MAYNVDTNPYSPLPVFCYGNVRCIAWPFDSDSTTGGLPGTGTVLHVNPDVDRRHVGIGRVTAFKLLRLHLVHIPDTVNLEKERWAEDYFYYQPRGELPWL